MTEKELAAIMSENGIVHTLAIYASCDDINTVYDDALQTIHSLVAHIEALEGGGTFKLLREAQRRIAELERERDAAVADLANYHDTIPCEYCAYIGNEDKDDKEHAAMGGCHACRNHGGVSDCFKWRGVADGEG